MLTSKEMDVKIAQVFEYKKVPSGNEIETDLWLEKDAVSGAFRFLPSTNLQQAMELAQKYELDIDFTAEEITGYTHRNNNEVNIDIKNLELLPRAICECVLLIEGVGLT